MPSLGKGPLLNSQCVTSPLMTAHRRVTVSLRVTSWLCGCSVKSMAAVYTYEFFVTHTAVVNYIIKTEQVDHSTVSR